MSEVIWKNYVFNLTSTLSTRATLNPGMHFLQFPLRLYQAFRISLHVVTSSSGLETRTGKIVQQDGLPQHIKTTADPFSGKMYFSFSFRSSIRRLCSFVRISKVEVVVVLRLSLFFFAFSLVPFTALFNYTVLFMIYRCMV